MKMKLTFLLLVSVFFVSCGMPSLFNLRTEEYSFKSIDNLSADVISGSFATTTDTKNISILQDPNTIGPSLMFFYTISGSDISGYPISLIQGTLISKFSSNIKKEPFGVNNPIYHELVFTTIDDTTVSLYEFKGINNHKFGFPYQILTSDSSVEPQLNSFTLQAIPTKDYPSRYYIQLKVDTDTSSVSFTPTTVFLYDFQGDPFFTDLNNNIPDSKSGEYAYLPNGASHIYLNIFSAFSVTGDFTNIFWSELNYIGQIKLPVT